MKMFVSLLLILNIPLFARAYADDPCKTKTKGTDFWLAFMESRNYVPSHELRIIVTADKTTYFTINTGIDNVFFGTFKVEANIAKEVILPWKTFETLGSEVPQNRGIHLVAQDSVSVYAVSWDKYSSDISNIYPTNALGNNYQAMCYQPYIDPDNPGTGGGRNSEFLIVATENNTVVKITPSKVTDAGSPKDSTFEITLNRGQVFQVQSENLPGSDEEGQGDLTGSKIESNKPVAVFSGSLGTTIPERSCCWDHLFEQMPPLHTWGRSYFTVPLKTRKADRIRILAAQDNTTIQIADAVFFTLNSSEFKEIETNKPQYIQSDKPILVAQFSMSHDTDSLLTGGNGDPFMIIVNSTEQWIPNAVIQSFKSPESVFDSSYFGIQRHFVNILSHKEETSKIFMDGKSIQDSFIFVAGYDFSYAQIETSSGSHVIESNGNTGFQAYPYGFGKLESYGYSAGSSIDLRLDLGENIEFFENDTLLLCFGDTLILHAGNHFDYYKWNTGAETSSIKVINEGLFWVEAGTNEGCKLHDSVFVKVSSPFVELQVENEIECEPFARKLDAGDGYSKYRWENDEGKLLGQERFYTASKTGNYKITVTDKFRCSATDNYSLYVIPTPDVEITGDPVVCNILTTILKVEISHEADSIWNFKDNFKWSSKSDLLLLTEQKQFSVTVKAPAQGDFEIYYSLKTIDNCIVTDTFKIRFHSMPIAKFELTDIPQCIGYSREIRFIGEATASADFLWDLGGRQFVDTLSGLQHFIVSEGANTGQPGVIKLIIDDKGCISKPFTASIGENATLTMSADKTRGCDSMKVKLTGTFSASQNLEYTWTINDTIELNGADVNYLFDEPGFYNINLMVKNTSSGCVNSFTIDSMISVFATPKTTIDVDTEECYSDSVLLIYSGHTDSTLYRWEFNGNVLNGFDYDSVRMKIINATEPVQLTVTEFGCVGNTEEKLVKRKPRFDFTVDTNEGCQPMYVLAESVTTDPLVSFYWITDSVPYPGEDVRYFFADTGRFDIALIAQFIESGCADTLLKPGLIKVNIKPRAKFEPNFTIAMTDNSTITFANYANNADSYFWDFADGETSTAFSPVHQYTSVGIFEVEQMVSNNWGCSDTFKLDVTIIPAVNYVPNAFRPNSENSENQTFMPVGAATTDEGFVLKIFTRLGDLIFESDSPLKPWDGKTKNGSDAPMGNYVWITNYTDIQGIQRSEKGQVLLIR